MKKGVAIFLSVAVSASLCVSVGVGSLGFTNWHVNEWFDHWGAGTKEEKMITESFLGEMGGGMVLSDNEESAAPVQFVKNELSREEFALYNVAATAERAYTVTATVDPDNEATNTTIVWSLAWKTASSWASGKSVKSYVMVTPNGEGYEESKTATVSCLQSFGEPIILTAACKYAPEIMSTIQLDYMSRFTATAHFVNPDRLNQDSEGNTADIQFGGDSQVTLEISSNVPAQSLYPVRIQAQIKGDYTLADTYNFQLIAKQDGKIWGQLDEQKRITLNEKTQDLIPMNLDRSQAVYFPHYKDDNDFSLGGGGGIINSIFFVNYESSGSEGMKPVERSFTEKYPTEEGRYNYMKDLLNKVGGKGIYLTTLTLRATGSREVYEYSTDVYITRVMRSVNITDVEINGGNITM